MYTRIKNILEDVTPYIFTRQNAPRITGGAFLTGMGIGLNILSPIVLIQTISLLTTETSLEILSMKISPMTMAGLYGTVWTLGNLVTILRNGTISGVGQNASRQLQQDYLQYLMQQSLQYHRTTHESDHDFRLNKIYYSMPEVCTQLFTNILPTTTEISIAVGILSRWYGLKVGLGLGGILLAYMGYSFATTSKIKKLREEYLKVGYESYYALKEAINHYETIQLFNNAEHTLQKIHNKLTASTSKQIQSDTTIAKIHFGQMSISGLGFVGLSLLVFQGVLDKRYRVSDFIIVSSYLAQFSTPLAAFGASINHTLSALTELETFFKEMKHKAEIVDRFPTKELNVNRDTAKIEFKNVCFHYPNGALDIKDLSFTILPGQTFGIVGESGSGKSTVASLLYRFCNPTSGSIFINGQDIQEVGLQSVRSAISIVPQTPVLFNDTIYNNIAFGGLSRRGGITKEHIENVIDAACLRQYIESLPEKLCTFVGERGAKMSGGQRQRLAIARALLKNPSIYIFDEATSALDSKTEKEIQKNIDLIANDITITAIIITHHLANVVKADHIIVLDKGKIIEQGTHLELLEKDGKYASLWRTQNSHQYEEEDEKEAIQLKDHQKMPFNVSQLGFFRQIHNDDINIHIEGVEEKMSRDTSQKRQSVCSRCTIL